MLPSERRSTVRVNKERLKAAMAAADRAEAGAAAAPEDDTWSRLNNLMADADAIADHRGHQVRRFSVFVTF